MRSYLAQDSLKGTPCAEVGLCFCPHCHSAIPGNLHSRSAFIGLMQHPTVGPGLGSTPSAANKLAWRCAAEANRGNIVPMLYSALSAVADLLLPHVYRSRLT